MHKNEIKEIDLMEMNEEMKKYKSECGCDLGAKLMIVVLVVSLCVTIYRYNILSMEFLLQIPYVLLFTCVAAIVGKIAGKSIAYRKYKKYEDQNLLIINKQQL